MSKLNEYNNQTKGVIHLLVTPLCNRDCKYCCNKQYDMTTIPVATEEEFRNAHTVFLTGGEPFLYCQPGMIATRLKEMYPNIKKIIVYTNAYEFSEWISKMIMLGDTYDYEWEDYLEEEIKDIDGFNVSVKNRIDALEFRTTIVQNKIVSAKENNRIYVFSDMFPERDYNGWKLIKREWQKDFVPASDSIFRRL